MQRRPMGNKRIRWVNSRGIYMPESALKKPDRQKSLPVVEAITAEETLGKRGTEKWAIELCRDVFWVDCILLASRIGALLEKYGVEDHGLQVSLAKQTYKNETRERVLNLLNKTHGTIQYSLFNNWMLLTFTKMALLYGSDDPELTLEDKSRLENVGLSFLVINDFVGISSLVDTYEDESNVIEAIIRNGAFFARERPGNLLPRYYDVLIDFPNQEACKISPHYVDINRIFHEATGFELIAFLALGLGVYSKYLTIKDFNIGEFVLNGSTFFSKTKVPPDQANRLLSSISMTREQFREQHLNKYADGSLGNYFDFTSIRQKPLIVLDDTNYAPMDIRYLVERITSGIYWTLVDNLQGKTKQEFMILFGELIQEYVARIFKRNYPESAATITRVFYDYRYGPGKGKRASDVILFYGESAIFIDVTVGRLRMEETAITGDLAAFREDIGKKIVETAGQIHRVINDFREGKLKLPGWSPDVIKSYYPVIVTSSNLPLFLKTYSEVRQMINAEGYLVSDDIAKIEILSIGEMEMIESLLEGGKTFIDILVQKTSDSLFRLIPMSHFLYSSYDNRMLGEGSRYLRACTREMFNRISPLLFEITDTLNQLE